MDNRVRPCSVPFTLHQRNIVTTGPYGEPLCCQVGSYRGFLLASNCFGCAIYDPQTQQDVKMDNTFLIFGSPKQACAFLDILLAQHDSSHPSAPSGGHHAI